MNSKFDYTAYSLRLRLKQREASELIGVKMGLVAAWSSRRALPSYESMCKLIAAGMTAEELFGPELAAKLFENSEVVKKGEFKGTKAEFIAGVKEALADISQAKL